MPMRVAAQAVDSCNHKHITFSKHFDSTETYFIISIKLRDKSSNSCLTNTILFGEFDVLLEYFMNRNI